MSSFRNITRALPRSLSGISRQFSRRTFATIPRSSLLQQSWKLAPRSSHYAFSSHAACEKEGRVDEELAAKLHSELELEKDIRDSDQLPSNIQDYLDSGPFALEDTAGREEVVLTRQFGDEKIRVTFTIADLNNMDEDPDQLTDAEDKAQFDEDENDLPELQSGGAQSKGTINQGKTRDANIRVAPEEPADRIDEEMAAQEDLDQPPAFPARINVVIEKAGKGALEVDASAEDGQIAVHNIYYFSKPGLANAQTPELDWSARNLYSGPPFGNLDQDLQLLLERYLDERGINTELALWIPNYIDLKEQREYVNWLSDVKSFVEA